MLLNLCRNQQRRLIQFLMLFSLLSSYNYAANMGRGSFAFFE